MKDVAVSIFVFSAVCLGSGQAGGQTKICSPVVPDQWRTTISAPSDWRWVDCDQFAQSVRADRYELGCLFPVATAPTNPQGGHSIFTWGERLATGGNANTVPANRRNPNPNCGWQ